MPLITIDDSNFHLFVGQGPHNGGYGLAPRDLQAYPLGCFKAAPLKFPFPLITNESEIADRINEQEKNQSSLQHIRDRGDNGNRIKSLDQNGQGYCWAHSSTNAARLFRVREGLPFQPLAAYMVACIIKNYRDQGGWGAESLQFISDKGICTEAFWAQGSMSRSNDKPEMWANAALNQVQSWIELSDNADERWQQTRTLLLMNYPVVLDYDWWSHSVMGCRLMSSTKLRIWNSWSDTWSDAGMGDLDGSKAKPDAAVAPISITAAAA